jgi:hypothetical protein
MTATTIFTTTATAEAAFVHTVITSVKRGTA